MCLCARVFEVMCVSVCARSGTPRAALLTRRCGVVRCAVRRYIMELCKFDASYDIRDKARLLRALFFKKKGLSKEQKVRCRCRFRFRCPSTHRPSPFSVGGSLSCFSLIRSLIHTRGCLVFASFGRTDNGGPLNRIIE